MYQGPRAERQTGNDGPSPVQRFELPAANPVDNRRRVRPKLICDLWWRHYGALRLAVGGDELDWFTHDILDDLPIEEKLERVREHLDACPCCNGHFKLILETLDAIEEP
jgi:hypothetical protein